MGGVILDSSVTIRGEREGIKIADLLKRIRSLTEAEDVGLTAIGVTELIHGIYRAESSSRGEGRKAYFEALIKNLPVFPYTLEVAELAGRIDGEQTMRGNIIPFTDLLIGTTALSLNYSVLTMNVRHFRLIPGLGVISF